MFAYANEFENFLQNLNRDTNSLNTIGKIDEINKSPLMFLNVWNALIIKDSTEILYNNIETIIITTYNVYKDEINTINNSHESLMFDTDLLDTHTDTMSLIFLLT